MAGEPGQLPVIEKTFGSLPFQQFGLLSLIILSICRKDSTTRNLSEDQNGNPQFAKSASTSFSRVICIPPMQEARSDTTLPGIEHS
jgi:hypothetical protein